MLIISKLFKVVIVKNRSFIEMDIEVFCSIVYNKEFTTLNVPLLVLQRVKYHFILCVQETDTQTDYPNELSIENSGSHDCETINKKKK